MELSDGSWSKFFTRVGSGQPYLWFGFGKFPLKLPNFSIFSPRGQKSHRIKKHLGQRRVGILFTAGQKYARVGSGLISNWNDDKVSKTEPIFFKRNALLVDTITIKGSLISAKNNVKVLGVKFQHNLYWDTHT